MSGKSHSEYLCFTPVVFIIFNRPEETMRTFTEIRKVKPRQLFIISDGPRKNVAGEFEKVEECRNILNTIDWDCYITRIYSDINLGCMRRIVSGLNEVFRIVDKAIILEDDCVPTLDFFRFMEWGLVEFENDLSIGMISGSNLISNKYKINSRNGYSSLINIWGWATWRYVWEKHDPFLSVSDIKNKMSDISKYMSFNWWQFIYWKELFKYTVYASNTWDFQLQFSFFRLRLLSVYPALNLIHNIGFTGNGTHTNVKEPLYIKETLPSDSQIILEMNTDLSKKVDQSRDILLAQEIWHFNMLTAFRLKIMNIIRFNF